MERMLKRVGYRDRERRGRGRSADRSVAEDVLFRKLLRVLPTPANACAEWTTVMEYTRRRFCGRRPDNELYRSNSFKFERFEGKEDAAGATQLALRKQTLPAHLDMPLDSLKGPTYSNPRGKFKITNLPVVN